MNNSVAIDLYGGGPGSGRHKVGDRVIKDPKIWKDSPKNPAHRGVVVKVSTGKNDKGKETTVYHVLTDKQHEHNEAFKKNPSKFDPIWDKPNHEGTPYTHEELKPEKKQNKG